MSFRLSIPLVLSLIASFTAVSAQQCNSTSLCPESAPCCSEFGFCGSGTFCLGGCLPLASATVTSCAPNPICENAQHTFNDLSRVLLNATEYDGNATMYDWVLDKGDVQVSDGELAMLLTQDNGGSRLSSTRFVHYGKISAKLRTGKWGGVVVAFITMSNIKDEIDWEFPGDKVTEGQSNFFWQGAIPAKTNGDTHGNLTDTSANVHEFGIDWQEDTLKWLVDGQVVRTVQRSDFTENGISKYPQTPSRVQLSIWPAGINSSAQGTIDWAGGLIDWNHPDYQAAGHFWASVQSVSIECADAQSNPADAESYVYGQNSSAFEPSVAVSNQSTISGAVGLRASLASISGVWGALAVGSAMAFGAFFL